ncbi:hypothetical protein AWZ03_000155 [Drosophila navojoa]|uniref:Uncharacterized protein n=1 Tax=Drosophila navojoa TaxID=7232 RepID=A0A484C081_DRONA|nr:hypothetical protein AWZ03_000155 [Drosophila navojoa]
MSSGLSDNIPIELRYRPVSPVDNLSFEERQQQQAAQRQRRDGPEYVRSQIQTARRDAQQIYDRRPPNTRNRSSSQQTESTSRRRRIHLAGQDGHATILLRLLSQSSGQREPEVCTTIRVTIDVPETPSPMMSSQTIHSFNATMRSPASAGQPRGHRRHRPLRPQQQPLETQMGVPAPEPNRQSPESVGQANHTSDTATSCNSITGMSKCRPDPPSELGSPPGTEPPSEPELELPQPQMGQQSASD